MKPTLSDQRLNIELHRRPQCRGTDRHQELDHPVDPPNRAFLCKLTVSGRIALDVAIARSHLQHWMTAVAQLHFQNEAFEVVQRGGHAFETLAEADELVLNHPLAEPSVEQPWFQMLHVPSIERDLRNAVLIEHLFEVTRDILV